MKRIYSIIILAACIACTQLENAGYDSLERTVFSAVVENGPDWQEGDMLGLYGSEKGTNERYVVTKASTGKSDTAEIYGPVVRGSRFMAYFPYDPEYVGGSADALPMMLASSQKYDADMMTQYWNHVPMAAGSLGEDGVFHLVYPLGIFSVEIELDKQWTVESMTLESKTKPLSGEVYIKEGGEIAVTYASSKSVDLDCGECGVSIAEAKYYFIVPPGIYPSKDLVLYVQTIEDGQKTIPLAEDVVVRRLETTDYKVQSVVLHTSDIPGFTEQDGTITVN